MSARVLVTGDREWRDWLTLRDALADVRDSVGIELVIHGACPMRRGGSADALADEIARRMGLSVKREPAKWTLYGKAAGPIRNQLMLDKHRPTCVLAFHDRPKTSTGTLDMVRRASKAGLPVRAWNAYGEVPDALAYFGITPEQPTLFGAA